MRRKSSPLDGTSDGLVNSSPMELMLESLHSLGRFCSDVTPFASGPRQAGQLAQSEVAALQTDNGRSRGRRIVFMAVGLAKMNQNRRFFFSWDFIRAGQSSKGPVHPHVVKRLKRRAPFAKTSCAPRRACVQKPFAVKRLPDNIPMIFGNNWKAVCLKSYQLAGKVTQETDLAAGLVRVVCGIKPGGLLLARRVACGRC